MATNDALKNELFLQRLEQWRANPTDQAVELLVTEHLRPFAVFIMSRAIWLTSEEKDIAVADSVWRSVRSLATYDPARFPPFKYFGRIAYNERLRAGSYSKKERARNVVNLDDLVYEDSEESDRLDHYIQVHPLSPDGLDWRRLWRRLPGISPAHAAVFESAVCGSGTFDHRAASRKRVAEETKLPKWAAIQILLEFRMLVNTGRLPAVSEGYERVRRLRLVNGCWQESA